MSNQTPQYYGAKKPPSWVVVVLLLIFFWPVGLYFLYRRLSYGKPMEKKGSVLTGMGVVFLVFFFVGCASNNSAGYAVVFLIMSIAFFVNGSGKKKLGKRYNRYVPLVIHQGMWSIDAIAAALAVPYERAHADLTAMIREGYFPFAQMDPARRAIFLPGQPVMGYAQGGSPAQQPAPPPQPRREEPKPVTISVQCQSCGANNNLYKSDHMECEYCGSPLKA